jgi:hypothetical protein
MTDFNTNSPAGKNFAQEFADTMSKEKDARIARDALRDLMLFNNSLESEMQRINATAENGGVHDAKLMSKMALVKEKYNYAMSGFKAFDDEMERFALTSLADAIQDLMFYLHNKRSH